MSATALNRVPRQFLAWLENLPPVFGAENVAPFPRGLVWMAVVLALVLSAVNVALIVDLGNTDLRTTNGLWKSPMVSGWEHGTGALIDNGEILYLPVYGFLCRLIPDSLMQFDVLSPVVTFRKIAVLNGIFGGLASAFLFLLAWRLVCSVAAAFVVAAAHACSAFVMLNSINSEDIMPAYALFIASVFLVFEYLHRGRPWMLALSPVLFALAMLLHWTVMLPALAGIGIVFLLAVRIGRNYLLAGLVWLAGFLLAARILVWAALPHAGIPLSMILFPGKTNTGWVGAHWDKLVYVLVGIGNHFSRGNNVSAYQGIFETRYSLMPMLASWGWALLALSACAVAACKRKPAGLKYFAIFALALFVVGEAEALYAQPQDPQLQIEPMFAATAGALVLARLISMAGALLRRSLAFLCTVALAANGLTNYGYFKAEAGGEDKRNILAVTELNQLFPANRTLFLTQGYEGWVTWQYVLEFHGGYDDFLSLNYPLGTPFSTERNISAADAAAAVRKQVNAALARGMRVVAGSLWTQSSDRFVALMSTLIDRARAREFDNILRNSYRTGKQWNTQAGTFVELLPLKP